MSFADILILVLVGAALLLALNYLRRRRQCSCGKGKSCRVATPRSSVPSAEQDPSALATERGKFGDVSKTALDDRKAKPLFEACAGCPLIDSCGKVNKMSDKRNSG